MTDHEPKHETPAERLEAVWRDVRAEIFGAPIPDAPPLVEDADDSADLEHDHPDTGEEKN